MEVCQRRQADKGTCWLLKSTHKCSMFLLMSTETTLTAMATTFVAFQGAHYGCQENHSTFNKIPMLEEATSRCYDWALLLDADAVISDTTASLTDRLDIIPPHSDDVLFAVPRTFSKTLLSGI